MSGSGADGQRAGQRDGQAGHQGGDREPAAANAEVAEHAHFYPSIHPSTTPPAKLVSGVCEEAEQAQG